MRDHAEIEELLRAATAIVLTDAVKPQAKGTAFRVAPQYAVTAAHVVRDLGKRVRLRFGADGDCFAEVIAASAAPRGVDAGRWSFDDHAVLRIEQPHEVSAPSVLLAEPALQNGDRLIVCALNAVYVEQAVEIYRSYVVRDVHPPRFFTIDSADRSVISGMSGAPVWSVRHGGVVGLVKGTEGLTAAQGGAVAALLDGLRRLDAPELYDDLVRAHDRQHGVDRGWSYGLVGGETIIRRWLVDVHALLARVPPAAARNVPVALVDELFRDALPPEPDRFPTLRDLAEYIGTESHDPKFGLARFCALAPRYLPAAPEPVIDGLQRMPRTIITSSPQFRLFEKRFLADRAVPSPTTTLFGVIRAGDTPVTDDRVDTVYRYEVHRRVGDQDIIPLTQSAPCPSYAHAKQGVKAVLDASLRELGAESVELVIALPDEHLTEEPLYRWLRPDQRPFGKYLLRLRRSRTWEKDNEQLTELRQRYERLRARDFRALHWMECVDPRGQVLAELQELFVGADPNACDGFGVDEPPTVPMLAASEANSLPVTLWRDERCPEHPAAEDDCAGAVFRRTLLDRLGTVPPIDWYDTIWREQRSSVESADRDEFWRKITFILDKPGESRRRLPLAGPEPSGRTAI